MAILYREAMEFLFVGESNCSERRLRRSTEVVYNLKGRSALSSRGAFLFLVTIDGGNPRAESKGSSQWVTLVGSSGSALNSSPNRLYISRDYGPSNDPLKHKRNSGGR